MNWVQVNLNGTIRLSVFGDAPASLSGPQDGNDFRSMRQRLAHLVGGGLIQSLDGQVMWGLQDGTVGFGGFGGDPGMWALAWTYGHQLDGSDAVVLHSGGNGVGIEGTDTLSEPSLLDDGGDSWVHDSRLDNGTMPDGRDTPASWRALQTDDTIPRTDDDRSDESADDALVSSSTPLELSARV